MARPKKNYKPLNIKMNKEIYDLLDDYCEEKGQTKTMAVERILKKFFNDYNSEKIEHFPIQNI